MSYFEPENKLTNPATKYISWKGSVGEFQFYNKETKLNVPLPKTFEFIELKKMITIKGFSDTHQGSFVSNEVKSLEETLNVRVFTKNVKGESEQVPIISGKYADIKDKLATLGASFSQSVYGSLITESEELELVKFQFNGSAIGEWITFLKNNRGSLDDGKTIVVSTNPEQQKKGATKYFVPTFKIGTVRKNLLKQSLEHYTLINDYINQYTQKQAQAVENVAIPEDGTVFESLPEVDESDISNVTMPF